MHISSNRTSQHTNSTNTALQSQKIIHSMNIYYRTHKKFSLLYSPTEKPSKKHFESLTCLLHIQAHARTRVRVKGTSGSHSIHAYLFTLCIFSSRNQDVSKWGVHAKPLFAPPHTSCFTVFLIYNLHFGYNLRAHSPYFLSFSYTRKIIK